MDQPPGDITVMLRASALGDPRQGEALLSLIYDDLKRLAASHLGRERVGHTLHPTALVHEAYLRLVNQRTAAWNDRLHFFSVASRIIRRVLIDHARARDAAKRGGGDTLVRLDGDEIPAPHQETDLVALDDALEELAAISDRQARIVELRFFGGLTVPEVATALGIGARSVDREWQAARAWLFHRLSEAVGTGERPAREPPVPGPRAEHGDAGRS